MRKQSTAQQAVERLQAANRSLEAEFAALSDDGLRQKVDEAITMTVTGVHRWAFAMKEAECRGLSFDDGSWAFGVLPYLRLIANG